MRTKKELAILVIEKDNLNNNDKIFSIHHFLTVARLTEEGLLRYQNEIIFYKRKIEFNQKVIKSNNKELIISHALNIVYQVLFQTEIPSSDNATQMEEYQKIIDEYTQYKNILSNNKHNAD